MGEGHVARIANVLQAHNLRDVCNHLRKPSKVRHISLIALHFPAFDFRGILVRVDLDGYRRAPATPQRDHGSESRAQALLARKGNL